MTGDVIGTCTEVQNEQYKLNLYYEKYALKETIRERISYYKNIDSDVPDIEGILKANVRYIFEDEKVFKEEKIKAEKGQLIDSGDLPMLPDDMKFIDEFLFYEVKRDACDAGREGEAIFRLVYNETKCKKKRIQI